jgi:hypothetical protein
MSAMSADPSLPTPPRTPTRVRPSAWWFALGGGLLVAAVVSGFALFAWTLSGFLSTDSSVPVDGAPHPVAVEHDDDLMLWADETVVTPTCTVVDVATGTTLPQRRPTGEFRRSVDGEGDWLGVAVVDGGVNELQVTCEQPSTPVATVEIGPVPHLGSFGLGLAATIVVPLLLGGLGLLVLLVTGILWSTRATTRR